MPNSNNHNNNHPIFRNLKVFSQINNNNNSHHPKHNCLLSNFLCNSQWWIHNNRIYINSNSNPIFNNSLIRNLNNINHKCIAIYQNKMLFNKIHYYFSNNKTNSHNNNNCFNNFHNNHMLITINFIKNNNRWFQE